MQESARHLEMTRARQMRVDTRDLPEANFWSQLETSNFGNILSYWPPLLPDADQREKTKTKSVKLWPLKLVKFVVFKNLDGF